MYWSIDGEPDIKNDQAIYVNEPDVSDYVIPQSDNNTDADQDPYQYIDTQKSTNVRNLNKSNSNDSSSFCKTDRKCIIIIFMGALLVVAIAVAVFFAFFNETNDEGEGNAEINVNGWSDWTPWGGCICLNAIATRMRHRSCSSTKKLCQGPDTENQNCSSSLPCSAQEDNVAVWEIWGNWSPCSTTCGSDGTQHRMRLCTTKHQNTAECEGDDTQIKNCSTTAQCPSASVCYLQYNTLSESYRRESFGAGSNCDAGKVDVNAWYRFNLSTGENGVLDHCPRFGACGTDRPIWMDDSHPTQYGVIQEARMAASWLDNCFSYSGSASVTKCAVNGEVFFLYKLWRPPYCSSSYCTQKYEL